MLRTTHPHPLISKVTRRAIHDIQISRTGQPLIRKGVEGRSAVTGHVATVFGATGFLGRYVVSKLASTGTQVIIPWRDEIQKRHLKVSGDLGRVVSIEFDLRNTESLEESVRNSDIVYNLIGSEVPTKNFTYDEVNVHGAARIAKACAKYDVDRLVHVSALGADVNSPSPFLRSKAYGEEAVKSIFPEATIVRPSHIYGNEDRFLNRLAQLFISSNNLRELVNPVYVQDVAKALKLMMYDDTTIASTFDFYGPQTFTMEEVYEIVRDVTMKEDLRINIPASIMSRIAKLSQYLWWPTRTPDMVTREFINFKPSSEPGIKGFTDIKDMTPATNMDYRAFSQLRMFRPAELWEAPLLSETRKLQKKPPPIQNIDVLDGMVKDEIALEAEEARLRFKYEKIVANKNAGMEII